MYITWYGTASILLTTPETSLLFDPYIKGLPEGWETEERFRERLRAFEGQENILITHGHLDHLSSVPQLYRDRPCTIYATATPIKTLLSQGFPKEKLRRIQPGDVLGFPGVTVQVYQGKHIRFDAGEVFGLIARKETWRQFRRFWGLLRMDLQYRENGECVVYDIAAEGKHVLLLGSAGLADDINYPENADALILPHQGRSDIDAHNRRIVERLRPKRVLLDHYDNAFPPISSDVPVEEFCRRIEGPAQTLVEGVPIEI